MKDTNSILTDKVNRTIQGNVAIQLSQMRVEFGTDSSGAIWLPNLELMELAPSGDPIWN